MKWTAEAGVATGAGALESMQQSNGGAADIVRRHGASACTDVSGFGLLGHLAEMTRASGVRKKSLLIDFTRLISS